MRHEENAVRKYLTVTGADRRVEGKIFKLYVGSAIAK